MANFDIAFEKVIGFEGGYVNDTNDVGGETKYGISKRAYPDLDIKNLTLDQAKEIYKKDYWDRIKGDEIVDQHIADLLFDTAVNMGAYNTVKNIQKILNVDIDGILGNITINALNSFDADKFIALFKLNRINRYIDICIKRTTNKKYLFGWVKRTLKV